MRNFSFLAFVVFSLAFVGPASAQTTIVRGPTVNPASGNIYLAVRNTSSANYGLMRDFARSLGGDLATINEFTENEWVRATFAASLGAKVWIGLNDAANEGSFAWSSGQTAAYRNWQAGEPSNTSTNDFVQLFDTDGRWACRSDGATQYAVIELPRIILVPQTVPTLQAALDLASPTNGVITEIVLAPGVHRGRFVVTGGRAVRIRSTSGPQSTILDGENSGRPLTVDTACNVWVTGLTFTNGRVIGLGGGIQCGGSLFASNCVIRNNEALSESLGNLGEGGGAYIDSGIAHFDQCIFESNRSAKGGSAVFNSESQVSISRSILRANVTGTAATSDDEIGVLTSVKGAFTLTNSAILGNRKGNSVAEPAAIMLKAAPNEFGYTSTARLSNCTLAGNDTNGRYLLRNTPGMLYAANCILMTSGGFLLTSFGERILENCISNASSSWSFVATDPMFVDLDGPDDVLGTADDDFRIAPGSPAIDAGDASLYLGSNRDLLGHPRFSGATLGPDGEPLLDIGAMEFEQPRCPADLDDGSGTGAPDGGVTIEDLLYFLTRFEGGC